MLRKFSGQLPTFIRGPEKNLGTIPNVKFFTADPYFGVVFSTELRKSAQNGTFLRFQTYRGVEWVRKNMDLKIQWVKGNCSKNCGYWASLGPTIIFSEKKSPYLNNLSPIHNNYSCADKKAKDEGRRKATPQLLCSWRNCCNIIDQLPQIIDFLEVVFESN